MTDSNVVRVEPYPFGKRFAVTFVDDTDHATRANIAPAYACLREHGLRITKTVWPLRPAAPSGGYRGFPQDGETLQDGPYREFCQALHADGFELAMHGASAGDNTRDRTIAAYRLFEEVFGHPPATNVMHARNRENIYWGRHAVPQWLLAAAVGRMEPLDFAGHQPESEFYWGDVCREKTRYVRQFEALHADTLRFDPATPYHDPRKPDVNWWFSATYGAGTRLLRLMTARTLDALARRRGASILHLYMYHYSLARGDGRWGVHPGFRAAVERMAAREDGWYVPVATLLDRIRAVRGVDIRTGDGEIVLANRSGQAIEGVALRVPRGVPLRDAATGRMLGASAWDQVAVGTLTPGASVRLAANRPGVRVQGLAAPPPRYLRLAAGYARRLLWQVHRGRRDLTSGRVPVWVSDLQRERATAGG
jgi:hypothetical protein